jgi:hypothetical protein
MEIAFEPYRKVSFRSYLQFEKPEDLVRMASLGAPAGMPSQLTLRWAKGVLFSVYNLPPSDSIMKEYIAGNLILDHIDFAIMPEYTKELKIPEKPLLSVNIIDLSEHTLFGPLAEWVKHNIARKKTFALEKRG